MKLKAWLDAERGRYTELARQLEVSVSRISQMADDGVPTKYMLTVHDFTGGEVTLQDMVEARTPDHGEIAKVVVRDPKPVKVKAVGQLAQQPAAKQMFKKNDGDDFDPTTSIDNSSKG